MIGNLVSNKLLILKTIYIKTIAILATNKVEESELKSPKETMEKESFTVDIISTKSDEIKDWAAGN